MSEQRSENRRDFLKSSSALAVGATALSQLATPTGAYAYGDETIKIGLVGCGGRGTGAATQALQTDGNVKLVAMADMFRDQLEKSLGRIQKATAKQEDAMVDVQPEHQFVGFDGYKELLKTDVDLVILATPPGFRPIHFEAALNAGKHVFMEKPVATDAAGVKKILEAAKIAKQKNLRVGVGLQRHHSRNYQDIIKRIHDGEIGDVICTRVYWNGGGVWDPRLARENAKTEMEYQLRNWYYYNWLCGDHICEQHIHNLDVGNWVMQDFPVEAKGMGGREVRTDKKYGEIFDHFAVEYTYADGRKMFSQCRHIRNCWNEVAEYAHGSKGHAEISRSRYKLNNGEEYRNRTKEQAHHFLEHVDLFHALRNDLPFDESEYGAMSTLTAIVGRLATYSGKPVNMQETLEKGVSIMPEEFAMDATPPTVPDANGYYPIPVPGVFKA